MFFSIPQVGETGLYINNRVKRIDEFFCYHFAQMRAPDEESLSLYTHIIIIVNRILLFRIDDEL